MTTSTDNRADQYKIDRDRNRLEYLEEKHKERMSCSMENLEVDFKDCMINDIDQFLESTYPADLMWEYVDSQVPIYNWELAQYLANDFSLAEPEDAGVIEGVTNIFRIISWSIYERLQAVGYEVLEEYKNDKIDHAEYMLDKWSSFVDILNDLVLNADTNKFNDRTSAKIDHAESKVDYFNDLVDNLNKLAD